MDLTKLAELENRVNAMLDRLAALTKNNEKLQSDLDAAEALIQELQTEREAILARVDTIIQRLD
jgi:chromosome segregation ATPase